MNSQTPNWGLLPHQVIDIARKRYWNNTSTLKALLAGDKSFPLVIPLKPPSGKQAGAHLQHLQVFVQSWKTLGETFTVHWKTAQFRGLGPQPLPAQLCIESFKQLLELLGQEAKACGERWERNIKLIMAVDTCVDLYPTLIQHLEAIEQISRHDAQLLAAVVPQLTPGLGAGGYLRALPLTGVDTKFLELNLRLVEAILERLHGNKLAECGGIYAWLNCQKLPRGLARGVPVVRPLCAQTKRYFNNLPLLQLPGDLLRQHPLPAKNILVVENLQSGLALPQLSDTIAVIGGGRNVAWTDAPWLANKNVVYWGDIDTWGLKILSDVRANLPAVRALMMDEASVKVHETRMVTEPEPYTALPAHLSEAEQHLFQNLMDGRYLATRLEQERLSSDYIQSAFETWP